MSISVTERNQKSVRRISYVWLITAAAVAVAGRVYEHFSHEIYSFPMMYAFLYPLLAGALPYQTLALLEKRSPGRLSRGLYNAGVVSLTVGSVFDGVLEIYGTSNSLTSVYAVAGVILMTAGLLLYLLSPHTRKKQSKDG